MRKKIFGLLSIIIGLFVGVFIIELYARLTEPEIIIHGKTGYQPHAMLGWLPPAGAVSIKTHEYSATYTVNQHGMNDDPITSTGEQVPIRISALGDSHTFAVGVSQDETWPNVLESLAFSSDKPKGIVYNLGVVGYSLGQYLLRMRDTEKLLDPQIAIVGFSMATDLYDIIPPRKGGFVYGAEYGRIYFDLDKNGVLTEKHDLVGKRLTNQDIKKTRSTSGSLRGFLSKFALYRRLKRSALAMWVATRLRPGGESLWPGLDTALKRKLDDDDEYRWKLAEMILQQMKNESAGYDAKLVLVNIPYLAQVYDEIWEASFGGQPEKYDRWIGGERLEAISNKYGIHYIDTTHAFVQAARKHRKWYHYREDAHPTAEGQRLIAETVYNALKEKALLPSD